MAAQFQPMMKMFMSISPLLLSFIILQWCLLRPDLHTSINRDSHRLMPLRAAIKTSICTVSMRPSAGKQVLLHPPPLHLTPHIRAIWKISTLQQVCVCGRLHKSMFCLWTLYGRSGRVVTAFCGWDWTRSLDVLSCQTPFVYVYLFMYCTFNSKV